MNLLMTVMFVAIAVSACQYVHGAGLRQNDTLRFSLRTMESMLCNRLEEVSVDLSYRVDQPEWNTLLADITPSEEEMVKAEVPVTSGNVQFRWLQNNHRGGCFDCWVIDDVTITVPGEFSNPQPISFIDYSKGCDDTLMNSSSLCGGTASVPRGVLAIYNSTQERSELPCDIFQPLEASGIRRCKSCPPESSEKAFVQMNFQLFIGNGGVMSDDEIETFDEGVEFAVKRVEDNQWIPLKFFTNTEKERSQSINVGHYDNNSNTLSLRGYSVSVTNVPNEVSEVHECICYSPSSLNQVQFRWLQTTEHRANSSGISVPRDTWYIDNVEISTAIDQTIFNDSFSSRNINQTLWSQFQGGDIENLMDKEEMVFFFGGSDDLTTNDSIELIITSRLAITNIVTTNNSVGTGMCDANGNCGNKSIEDLLRIAENITDEATAFAVVDDLVIATQTETSLSPRDINNTISILTTIINFLSEETGMANANKTEPFVDILNNVLNETNFAGFQELGTGAQILLDTAEVIGGYIARAVASDDTVDEVQVSRDNIALRARTFNATQDITFPNRDDLVNFTVLSTTGESPAHIIIPAQLLEERINESSSLEVAVANIIFQNLEDYLPPLYVNGSRRPRSVVISSQVDVQSGMNSAALQQNPVTLNFSITLDKNDTSPRCAFWSFSDPVGTGGWSFGGVTTDSVTTEGSSTVVQCSSTHLTSFAVLVDVGGLQIDNLALQIVSYIGIGISSVCLVLTILFFLTFGKKLFNAVHDFIHLNLAIALFLGYLTFAVGIELAADSEGACKAVAALLHYFFLASFSWMLCEGIMLYLMLVLVFSSLTKKWWFFFLLGWCLPLPFLMLGLAAFLDEFGVKRNDGTFKYCWLSSGKAIWTFAAPMVAIILVNIVFLIMVLVRVYQNAGAHSEQMQQKGKRVKLAKSIIKASVILLPLLGLTWVFGLFAVNENSLVFAWLFTLFNSLQGSLIFICQVLRSEKVWGFIKDKFKNYIILHSKSGSEATGSKAASKAKSNNAYSSAIPLSEVNVKHDSSIAPDPTMLYPDDTIQKPLDQENEVTLLAYAKLDKTAEVEKKEDLATTATFKEIETPSSESEQKAEQVQLLVTPEGNTIPEEKPECTLGLMKHLSADGSGAALLGTAFDRSNVMVLSKPFGTELLHKRNEKLRVQIESLLSVTLENKEGGPEVVSNDVLLCKIVNKLHPRLITTTHDPDKNDVLSTEKHIQNVTEFIAACKKLNVPQEKMCSSGDIIDGRNQHLVIACLEYLLQSSS